MGIKKLFTVPDGEKVTEKALRRVLISSICSILLCMTCLVSTTWAWFVVSIENTGNAIVIGSFSVDITVDPNNYTLKDSTVYTLAPADTPYTVTIANTGTSKGYCTIGLSGGNTVYSTGTLKPSDSEAGSIRFEITVKSATDMTIEEKWGDAPSEVTVVPSQITVGEESDTPGADTPGSDMSGPETTETDSTEPSSETSTEPSTEPSTVPSTEASTEPTEAKTT